MNSKRIPWLCGIPAFVGIVFSLVSLATAEPITGFDSLELPVEKKTEGQTSADALALFKARDYQGSLRLWREAAKKTSDMPPPMTIMAQLYAMNNMPAESKQAVEQAIAEEPADPEAHMFMAVIAIQEKDFAKAEDCFTKAETLLSKFGKSAKRKSLLQTELLKKREYFAEVRQDWPGAIALLDGLVKLEPKNISAMQRIAFCLFQQDQTDAALEKLREASAIDPRLLPPEAVLAQFYASRGDKINQEKWMEQALASSSDNLALQLLAANNAIGKKQFDRARKHAIAATKIDQKSPEAKLLQAMIAMMEKNYVGAELFYEAAMKESADNPAIRNNLAMALIEQGDEAKSRRALELAEYNAKQLPHSPALASTYGYILFRMGRLDEAEAALQTAKAIATKDPDTAYTLALVAAQRGRKEEAKKLLEDGLKSEAPSMFQQEAGELLEKLKKELQ